MHPKLLVPYLLWTATAATPTDVAARSSKDQLGSATPESPFLSSSDTVNPLHPLAPRVAPQSVLQDIEPPPPCAVGLVSITRSPLVPLQQQWQYISNIPDIRFLLYCYGD